MKNAILPVLCLFLWFGAQSQTVETSITVPYTSSSSPTFPALLYLPDDYGTTGTQTYPLLIFLHGSGESCPPLSTIYNSTTAGGPPYLIEHGQWPTTGFTNPKDGKTYKFIVVSPQSNCNSWSTTGDQLENIINYLVANYRVDLNRIYGTGLSAGGGGITEYAAHLDAATETILTDVRTHKFAAMVPMSLATNTPQQSWANVIVADSVRVWGFGDPNNDVYGSTTQTLINDLNTAKSGFARFTQFNTGHGPWAPYYNPTYRENFTFQGVTANMNIYEWMLINTRSTAPVTNPIASAGSNQSITLPTNSVTLTGSGTPGSSKSITGYLWTETSGPASTIVNASSASTLVNGLVAGTYVFTLKVTQNDGQTATSTVTITVNAATPPPPPVTPPPPTPPTGGYNSPVSSVSGNQSIGANSASVTSSYTLTGASLKSIAWTKFSVPGQAIFKLGVLGSSTSAGNGASVTDSSYVGRLTNYYTSAGIVNNVINLAYSGYNIYQAMPTGYVPPADVTAKLSPADVPDPTRNITAMLAQNPNVVIVCFPTNGFDVLTISEIMTPFQAIYDACKAKGVECYITTSQPRTDAQFSQASQNFLQVVRDSILNRFGSHAIDFYDAVTVPGTTQQMPQYMYGDSIHLNDAGHRQLFNLVVGTNIFQNLISSSSVINSPASANTTISNLPTGVNKFQVTVMDSHVQASSAVTAITVTGTTPPPSGCSGKKYVLVPDPVDSSVYQSSMITPSTNSYLPGDTLVLNSAYSSVDIQGLHGSNSCPIVITNQNVTALITKRLNLDGCTNVKLTGSGTSSQYGIMIQQDPQLRQQSFFALNITDRSSNIEVERLYIHNVDMGISCETNESCADSLNYPNWVINNIFIHDNKIVGTWNEGMYLGNTSPDNASYDLRPVVCNGVTTYPAPMKNGYTKVYNNIVDSTGRGGIQLANADSGVSEIYNNTVSHNGLNGDDAQGTGISVGLYTRAYIHDNKISDTYTWGIASLGAGATNIPLVIENNTIDSAGYLRGYDLATTNRIVYDPRTEPIASLALAWPQSIELATKPRLYTTDNPNPGTAIKGQDSTQFWVIGNIIGLKKNNVAINIDNDYPGYQYSGNIICGNINKGSGTPAVLQVVAGVNYTSNCNSPTVSAGSNQTITLPVNSTTLTGTAVGNNGATITSTSWKEISGPNTSNISTPTSLTTTISAMIQGVYVFQITATDNNGLTGSSTVTITVNPSTNIPPIANAGADQSITLPVNTVNLDGSVSKDPDGSISSYSWTQVSGPAGATIANPTGTSTSVNNLVAGVYLIQLKVTDNLGATALDTVKIIVNNTLSNQPPVANAGADVVITLPTSQVSLNGSASLDPDGTLSSYLWSQVSGPSAAAIGSPANANTTISSLQQGIYVFTLKVTDNKGATDVDSINVTVNQAINQPPIANAGASKTITLPVNSVILDGSLSSDPDGSITAYSWTQISGPSAAVITGNTLSEAIANNLIAGVYTFELTVTDNSGATAKAGVKITVVASGAQPPNANAGANQTITLPINSTTIDGSGSNASSGSIVSYAWTEKSGPSSISLTNTAQDALTNLQAGVYVFYLTVTDSNGDTGSDSVTITVKSAANQAPVANAGSSISLILPDDSTRLDGTKSYDPDGTIAAYKWTQISGPGTPTTSGINTATLTLNGLVAGQYTYQLAVTDNSGASTSAQVIIRVSAAANIPPIANAGPNQSITAPANSVILNGTASYDPDGSISTYNWTTISGPGSVTINNSNTATPSVIGLQTGIYIFELTVTDNKGATAKDQVTITVLPMAVLPNQSPVANAGPNQTITLPVNTVSLNGTSSFDPDGTITSYSWKQISGPSNAVITGGNTSAPTATQLIVGQYVFQLTVTDNNGASSIDQVTITVNASVIKVNIPPIANAGVNDTVRLPNNSYVLDASGSVDPDGTISSYQWQQIGGPNTVTSSAMNNAQVTISDLQAGVYEFEVTVTDNSGATSSATMRLIVVDGTSNTDQFIVYPNPAHDVLNGSITSPVTGIVKISIYDMSGRSVLETEAEKSDNLIVKTMNISPLASGMYIIQINIANQKTMVTKFVKN